MKFLRGVAWLVAAAFLVSAVRGVGKAFVFSGDSSLGSVSFGLSEVLTSVGALLLAVVLIWGLWQTGRRETDRG